MTVVGWYYDSQSAEWPLFKVYANDGRPIPSTITLRATRDLQQLFSDDSAGNDRFRLAFCCPDTCTIVACTTPGPGLRLVLDRNRSLSVASGKAELMRIRYRRYVFVSPGERFAEAIRIGLVRLYNTYSAYFARWRNRDSRGELSRCLDACRGTRSRYCVGRLDFGRNPQLSFWS